jgi:hypothetical protein
MEISGNPYAVRLYRVFYYRLLMVFFSAFLGNATEILLYAVHNRRNNDCDSRSSLLFQIEQICPKKIFKKIMKFPKNFSARGLLNMIFHIAQLQRVLDVASI